MFQPFTVKSSLGLQQCDHDSNCCKKSITKYTVGARAIDGDAERARARGRLPAAG